MDNALAMRVVERYRDLASEPCGVLVLEAPVAREPHAQRLADDERHRIVGKPVGVARAEQRDDVRVQKSCGELDFAAKPFDAHVTRHVRRQDLHDHAPTQRAFLGHEDATHSAARELTLERVSPA